MNNLPNKTEVAATTTTNQIKNVARIVDEEKEDENTDEHRKGGIFERINKRNKDRQNDLDVKLEQRNKENVQLEGVDYFSQTFTERTRDIELRLRNINETAEKNTNTTGTAADLIQLFTNITLQIQELQRYLTASTMFLSDYKIKACQNTLTALQNSCEETRLRLLPKKKFGFSGKKVSPKVTINPKVSNNRSDILDGTAAGDNLLATKMSTTTKTTTTPAAFTWTLSNLKHEYICLRADEVDGKDITMSNLEHCFIELQGHAGSVQLSHTNDCTLLCGPVARSLFAEYCERLTLAVACQQLRLHSSKDCRLHLQVTCRAVIEDCHGIKLSPYVYEYDNLTEDFQASGLNPLLNNYKDVADFNWLSPDVPSPNWKLFADCPVPNWNDLREEFKMKNKT